MNAGLDDQLTAAREETSRILTAALAAGKHVRMGATRDLVHRVTSCTPCVHLIKTPVQPTYAVLGDPGSAECWTCFQARTTRVRACSDCGAEAAGPLQQVVGQLEHVTVIRLLDDRCAQAL